MDDFFTNPNATATKLHLIRLKLTIGNTSMKIMPLLISG